MRLLIKIENNQPVGHPMIEENVAMCYPNIDFDNLPSDLAHFERVERPALTVYQMFEDPEVTYELVDGVYKDVWHIREMTFEEKSTLQETSRAQPHSVGWAFNEEICGYEPPIPYPSDGEKYIWDDTTLNWVLYTPTE